jgi:hypothetical protein
LPNKTGRRGEKTRTPQIHVILSQISGNKKPINLEPKMAGLMGSTNWGHQRKAVAIVMTGALRKSSRQAINYLPVRSS